MRIVVVVPGRAVLVLAGLLVGVVGLLWWSASPAASGEEQAPLATFAFLARADNPVDALAAGALAGQLGGPVYLTGTVSLDAQAAEGLAATDPQVVVLAGGETALSEQIETDVAEVLPDAVVRRVGGSGRTETARLLNALPAELGIGRPVLTGATVSGDVGIDGTLTVEGQDVGATLAALTERLDGLESDLDAANERVAELEATLAGVSREGDLLTFEGMNVQVTNGEGHTASANGLGNLIVGYNEDHTDAACQPSGDACDYVGDGAVDARTGSHMLVVGADHGFTSYGGILGGLDNATAGVFASVTGGQSNTASGHAASATGGDGNTASGAHASVAGGQSNVATGPLASVGGGFSNSASGLFSVVSAGVGNDAAGAGASVSGGGSGTASGPSASVTGGFDNTAGANSSTIAGGRSETIPAGGTAEYDSQIGTQSFADG